jgi:hypothetical protein
MCAVTSVIEHVVRISPAILRLWLARSLWGKPVAGRSKATDAVEAATAICPIWVTEIKRGLTQRVGSQ